MAIIKCDVCKIRPAKYTSKIDGAIINVCDFCKDEFDNNTNYDIIKSILLAKGNEPHEPESSCVCCGRSMYSILKSGYVGCTSCYSYYREELRQAIEIYQGASKHLGKVPILQSEQTDSDSVPTVMSEMRKLKR